MMMPSLFFRLGPWFRSNWFGRKSLDAKNKQYNSTPGNNGNISNNGYKNKQFLSP